MNGIPFHRAGITGDDIARACLAVDNGHISGDGRFCREAEATLADVMGAARVMLTTSCTHALEMAALLLDVGAEDEVILPSFTFVSTANAFALRGARPVFADIDPETLNLDPSSVETHLSPRTRAMVPVHYAGVACEMETLVDLAESRGITVIEDNAHGLFGSYRGRALGTFGSLATLSFHETKNVTCGEGGGLVVNDPALLKRAEILRDKGTDRARFFRGEVDKYTWQDLGSSYVLSEILAAVLVAQLETRDRLQARRHELWTRYAEGLASWADQGRGRLPFVPADRQHPAHLFYVLLPNQAQRDRLMIALRSQGIQAVFHYQPLHVSPMGRTFGGRPGQCPVAEDIAGRILRLPLFPSLSNDEHSRILDAVTSFR